MLRSVYSNNAANMRLYELDLRQGLNTPTACGKNAKIYG